MDTARQMQPTELMAWRRTYMVSQTQLADLLGVHVNTVARWEKAETRIPNMVPLALETLTGQREKLIKHLQSQRRAMQRQAKLAQLMEARS